MPKHKSEIFPYSPAAITANFTRACKLLVIEDLHFHDLSHEGISRLFEMAKVGFDALRGDLETDAFAGTGNKSDFL